MRHTLFCVLPLFLLNTLLYCGHTQDAELTFAPNSSSLFNGEFVTFVCDMGEGTDTDWQYRFNRNGQQIVSFNTNNWHSLKLTPDLSGDYQCIGRHKSSTDLKKRTNNVTLSVSAHRPRATLRADRTAIPVGGTVTLTCSVEGSTGWNYEWFRRTSDSDEDMVIADGNGMEIISITQEGIYWCQGRRGNPVFFTEQSDVFRIEITLPNGIFVTLQHNWTQIFSGETFAVICQIEGGGDTEWEYEWRTTSPNTPPTHSEYRISHASVSHSGHYWCKGRKDLYSSTEWSVALPLKVSSNKPRPTVTANRQTIPADGDETMICSLEEPAEWKYYWFRRASVFSESQMIRDGEPNTDISISQGGIYSCKGGRGNPVFFTEDSDAVTIEKRVSDKAVVSLQPNWPLIFSGETITVRCDIHRLRYSEWEYFRMEFFDYGLEYKNTEWEYEWSSPNSDTVPTDDEYRIRSATVSNSGNYRCMGKLRQDLYSSTEWSDVITLTVSAHRPKANLSADNRAFSVGGSVTLTCSVNPSSSGWKYFWYRGKKTSEPLTTQLSAGQIRVSEEGVYWCRGGRGEPVYYTEYSDPITISKNVTNKAVVTLQPNWSEIYSGETITLRCEIQGGGTEWEYEWTTTSSHQPPNVNEYWITSASPSDSEDYWCKGRMKGAQQNSTGWSNSLKLTVSHKPEPVLTVSPSWLSAGASVTLKCEVEHPSAGWRFYWYEAVPDPSDDNYTYELLPGSSGGTEQDSYIVHGQTHSAAYSCRGGRGDLVVYTHYSEPKFVWSGDFHSSASLTVSPDRAQHFTSDSVSLSCEGNSTEWRVRSSTQIRYLSDCSYWGTMNGSTCNIEGWYSDAVYWCESESGEFSNAVNITTGFNIILVSPVHPVTKGDSVTLGCNLETEELVSNVTFYKNNKLIQNDFSAELKISGVSESDEGFYKCEYSGDVSPESWMSVKSSDSAFPVPLIVGLVVGILLIVLLPLLLLCWYRKSKDTCCHRLIQCQGTNQSSATAQTVNQDKNEQQVYSSLLHGDVCVYETISDSGNTGSGERSDEYRNVTSQIQLKGLGKRGIRDDSAESSDYSNVNPDSTGS
ncbi:Fc receptor-like protein 5 [Pagrus major]|uniref:Fc receptor-like protein 5 n=1 Tax=Pagrus major TaxID=143350 RepID=UPI003CC8CCDD